MSFRLSCYDGVMLDAFYSVRNMAFLTAASGGVINYIKNSKGAKLIPFAVGVEKNDSELAQI